MPEPPRLASSAYRAWRTATLAALVVSITAPASAHLVGQRFGDYYGGLLHPITALEHAVAFLGLALLAGQQEPQTARRLLATFVASLLVGSTVAPSVAELPFVALFNRLSFVLLGLLVATAWSLPRPFLVGLTAVVGLSHGYENGLEITVDLSPLLYSAGVASTGLIVVTLIAAASLQPRPEWAAIAVRAAGSWIAAIGLMMVGLAVSGQGG